MKHIGYEYRAQMSRQSL